MSKTDRKSIIKYGFWLIVIIVVCGTIVYITKSINSFVQPTEPKEPYELDDLSEDAEAVVTEFEELYEDVIIGTEGTVVDAGSTVSLEDIVRINQIRTLTYNYNSICNVDDLYYVAYEGTVVLGIDGDEIETSIDEENMVISVLLPPVTVQSCEIDSSSLEFIFMDDDYDTPSTATNSQALCKEDLVEKTSDDTMMMELASENAMNEVRATLLPIIGQFYSEYTLEVEFKDQ